MRILVVSQYYYPENVRITDICETLVNSGHTVKVITAYPNYPEGVIYKGYSGKGKKEHKNEIINGVEVERCFTIPRGHSSVKLFLNYYSVCLSLKRMAKRMKDHFDIVLVNQLSPVMVGWAGIAYAKKHKVPCLLYCYDLWPASLAARGVKESSIVYKYFGRVSKKIYTRVDHILITSKCFAEYFTDVHHISKDKISYLPQYCEDLFGSIKNEEHEGYNFVFAGNIGKVQSVETIIKAANIIKSREDIKIHIVGDGSDLEKCKNLAKKLETKNVVFHGRCPLEEMPKFYSLADAMIVTLSKNDLISKTLPGKVQSYMAAGKPIIGAIDGETKIIVGEAKCGLICNSEDYQMLANLFLDIFSKKNANQMGKNGKMYYEMHFSKNVFFANIESIINYYNDNNKKA